MEGERMSEELIGVAKHERLGNDLFWDFLKLEWTDDNKTNWIHLSWRGYNDTDWWTKWCRQCDTAEQDGRRFRIDFVTSNVYEVVDE